MRWIFQSTLIQTIFINEYFCCFENIQTVIKYNSETVTLPVGFVTHMKLVHCLGQAFNKKKMLNFFILFNQFKTVQTYPPNSYCY